jgi:hypothetical protein
MLFVLSLIFVLLADLFVLFVDPHAEKLSLWMKLLPISLIGVALIRLQVRMGQFKRCMKTLKNLVGANALAFAYRLTDDEIIQFSKAGKDEAQDFYNRQDSFRWRFLKAIY